MAKPYPNATNPTYVVVERGDTLSQIAEDYAGGASKWQQLASINNIPNPNCILAGQKIYLVESPDADKPVDTRLQVPIITHIGFQAGSTDAILVRWAWNPDHDGHFDLRWWYGTNDGIAYKDPTYNKENHEYTEEYYHVYTPPSNAKRVIFQVAGRADDGSYVDSGYMKFELTDRQPDKPPTPTIKIRGSQLTATVNNLGGAGLPAVNEIEFQVIKNDTSLYKTGTAKVLTSTASWTTPVVLGNTYKVRCRARNDFGASDWTEYSENIGTQPAAPSDITVCRAETATSVYLEWASVETATTYEIQYAVTKTYLDSSNMASTVSTTDASTHFTIGNLQTGSTLYFRVRAKNSNGDSDWSPVKSTAIGTKPAPPTTWSSTDVAITGEEVVLYWFHNTEDNSNQTKASVTVEVWIEDESQGYTYDIDGSTSLLQLDTSEYPMGADIRWAVRTAGVTGEFGALSVSRTIKIVGRPYLDMMAFDVYDNTLDVLTTYPIRVTATAGPATQRPIGYNVTVIADTTYEMIDRIGNPVTIHVGDTLYSKYFSGPGDLSAILSANDLNLENGQSYTIRCVAAMDSGLTVECHQSFFVNWDALGNIPTPDAEIIFDDNILATHIRPYCNNVHYTIHQVGRDLQTGVCHVTGYIISSSVYGEPVPGLKTTTGEQVYFGVDAQGDNIYYCTVKTSSIVEGVSLAVYRREFDGSFVEIAKDIDSSTHTFVTDPHPSLDYARYRVVATHRDTGVISYYDVHPYHIGGNSIIIQWNEAWTDLAIDDGNFSEKPAWSGSLLKLTANIDISNNYDTDSSFGNYIGRKHPVAYYGTHVGETSTWNTVIPKDDKETLYALRRLAVWMGNVYVREPSGSGYWANVKVSFSQKHRDVTIPVSLSITRVEGGL